MAIIQGTHCLFDTIRRPDREDFATGMVAYCDRKIPAVFQELTFNPQGQKVRLEFGPDDGGRFAGNFTIRFGDNHDLSDKGCSIHEIVHATEEPACRQLYFSRPETQFLFEGVADYYRITLSDDHQGDHPNDSKKSLVAKFSTADLYGSGPEFVAYMRRRTGKPDFVRLLNDALRSNDYGTVMGFLNQELGRDYAIVLGGYEQYRNARLARPAQVSRYAFFTTMRPDDAKSDWD